MPNSPHDALFKFTFSNLDTARGELLRMLPAEALAEIRLEGLEAVPATLIDESLKDRYSDLLFRAPSTRGECLVYLLLEHKSESDRWTPLQLLDYLVQIWKRHHSERRSEPLPPIVPLVIHHGEAAWSVSPDFHALFDEGFQGDGPFRAFIPRFSYLVDDLTTATDEDLRGRVTQIGARVILLVMRDARRPGQLALSLAACKDLLYELRQAPDRDRLLRSVSNYLYYAVGGRPGGDKMPESLMDLFRNVEPEPGSWADEWLRQGREEGVEKGRRQALLGVAAAMLSADKVARLAEITDIEALQAAFVGAVGERSPG